MSEKISIVMSVFNEPTEWLDQSITSILNQTYTNFEFIIINDGSSNKETIRKLVWFAEKDRRVIIINRANQGLTNSLKYGINISTGKIIFRQDADDFSAYNRIQTQINFLKDHPNCILVGLTPVFCQINGQPLWIKKLPLTHKLIVKSFDRMNPFCHGSVCFRKKHFLQIGGYDFNLPVCQDYDLFWRMSKIGEVININEPLYFLRKTGTSISSTRGLEQKFYDEVIRNRKYIKNGKHTIIAYNEILTMRENFDKNDKTNKHFILMRNGDELLMSGQIFSSIVAYSKSLKYNIDKMIILKIARWLGWICMPWARYKMFAMPLQRYRPKLINSLKKD